MAEKVIYEYDLPDGSILELEGEVGQEAKADAEYKRIIATEFAPQPELTKTQTALDYVKNNSIVGLGTGSTANYFIDGLAKKRKK